MTVVGGTAALAIWVDIDPDDDALFEHWHSREHMQERVGCPGWLRGSRFRGVERPRAQSVRLESAERIVPVETTSIRARISDLTEPPARKSLSRYLLFYDADSPAAFESDVYYARLRSPTAMSRTIFPRFRDTWRTVCSVERRLGDGVAAAVLTVRLSAGEPAPFDALAATRPARLDLLAGQAGIGQAHSAEKDLRGLRDRQIDRAVVAFFWSVEAARAARDVHAPAGELFTLRHAVSRADLPV
ncbi:MAG: hypothetical protein ACOY4R_31040 [Pseudomonadota bacterium]